MKAIVLVLIAILYTTAPTVKEKPHAEKVVINGEEREVSQQFIEQCKEADERINASFAE